MKYHKVETGRVGPHQTVSRGASAMAYTSGIELLVWYERSRPNGWYGMAQGIAGDGNAWEGDDQGPFKTRAEAEEHMKTFLDQ